MGVEKVNHPQVVARFILPELQSVPSGDRKRLLDHVRQHWNTLKREQAVVDTLKEVSHKLSVYGVRCMLLTSSLYRPGYPGLGMPTCHMDRVAPQMLSSCTTVVVNDKRLLK